MKTLTYVISQGEEGMTVGAVLRRKLWLSAARVNASKYKDKGILLNGEKAFTNFRVHTGDVIAVDVGDEPCRNPFPPVDYPLEILWEDEDLLILNKEAGMAVYGSREDPRPTLAGAISHYLGPQAVIHAVSRLDKGTSGIIVYCKSGYIHEKLCRMQHSGDFHRIYRAIAVGRVEPEKGVINQPILRVGGVRRAVAPGGQEAVTCYERECYAGGFSLLKIIPETGRTHQIRVHMAYLGYPLAGDFLYGQENPELIARPALHSSELHMRHPVTGESLHLVCPLPQDFTFFPHLIK